MAITNIRFIYGIETIDQFFHRVARELRHCCARSADELADAIDAGETSFNWTDRVYDASARFETRLDENDIAWTEAEFITNSDHGLLIAVNPANGTVYIDADDLSSDTFWGDSNILDEDGPEGTRADFRATHFLASLFLTDEEVEERNKVAEAAWRKTTDDAARPRRDRRAVIKAAIA